MMRASTGIDASRVDRANVLALFGLDRSQECGAEASQIYLQIKRSPMVMSRV